MTNIDAYKGASEMLKMDENDDLMVDAKTCSKSTFGHIIDKVVKTAVMVFWYPIHGTERGLLPQGSPNSTVFASLVVTCSTNWVSRESTEGAGCLPF